MIRKKHLFVFLIIGFTTILMTLNPVSFNRDVFIVTSDAYSNSEPQTKLSNFNPRKIHPWNKDPSCQHLSVQMSENVLPKWALTSFPGSGVTWTRQMIEGLTGIYTGSVHKGDPLPFRENNECMGITDDPFCNCTIIDKDHEATEGIYTRQKYLKLLHSQEYSNVINETYNYRGILLLRNPMDVVVAHQNHLTVGKFDTAPLDVFRGPQWDEMVETVAYAWADHAIRWIEQIKQGTVIFYENLLGPNPQLELERLLGAMNFRPIDADRMRCTLAHKSGGEYKRNNKNRILIEKHHYIKFMKSINRVQQSLRKRKWPQLPVHLFVIKRQSPRAD